MFVVDTNILLYAADEDAPEYPACIRLLENWREEADPWHVTWNVLYEFMRVVTHPRVKPRPWSLQGATDFVDAVMESPSLSVLSHTVNHLAVLQRCADEIPAAKGNLIFDFHTAVLMREHGIRRVYTNDMDFHRFPWVEVVNPLA